MTKKRALGALIALNVLLAVALTVGPVAAQIFPRSALLDCCTGHNYCCHNCCWFVNDCSSNGECLKF